MKYFTAIKPVNVSHPKVGDSLHAFLSKIKIKSSLRKFLNWIYTLLKWVIFQNY